MHSRVSVSALATYNSEWEYSGCECQATYSGYCLPCECETGENCYVSELLCHWFIQTDELQVLASSFLVLAPTSGNGLEVPHANVRAWKYWVPSGFAVSSDYSLLDVRACFGSTSEVKTDLVRGKS